MKIIAAFVELMTDFLSQTRFMESRAAANVAEPMDMAKAFATVRLNATSFDFTCSTEQKHPGKEI